MYSSKKSVFIGCFVWCKMFFRNTLVAHKSLINPYFMRFEVHKEIIFQERRYQEKPIFQGLQKLWNAVRCAGIYIECNTYAAGMQQIY